MTDLSTQRTITTEHSRVPAGYTLITLYVKLHTAREPELYASEEFVAPVDPEKFEATLQAEGGKPLGELHSDFSYLKMDSNEFSVYSYTFSNPAGYLDYDIEWVEELITKARQ